MVSILETNVFIRSISNLHVWIRAKDKLCQASVLGFAEPPGRLKVPMSHIANVRFKIRRAK